MTALERLQGTSRWMGKGMKVAIQVPRALTAEVEEVLVEVVVTAEEVLVVAEEVLVVAEEAEEVVVAS
jgi:hypothetical protein